MSLNTGLDLKTRFLWKKKQRVTVNEISFIFVQSQSQQKMQSENLRLAVVYVIAKLFARPQKVKEKKLTKDTVCYSCYLKSNNIIPQRKISNIEKQFYQ